MFIVIAGLCAAAFTLGGAAATVQGESTGIPDGHPVGLALRFRQELGLSGDQIAKFEELQRGMARDFAPVKERADSIQRRMQELQQSGKQDPAAGAALQREAEGLGDLAKPIIEKYAHAAGEILSPEQREKLMRLSEAHGQQGDPRQFVLMFIMQAREQLGINPQQFTKLQFLQADFIRAFAPVREQMEMTQMEAQQKPTPEIGQRMEALQHKVQELQAQFSERAMKEVLQPNQRAKLGELLGGEHRPGQGGK